jgi:hypothetical protein
MSTAPLPERPNLDQLKQQAKDLKRAVDAGDQPALAHAVEHVPNATADAFTLSRAQLVIARHHGFSSWRALRERVGMATTFGRAPDEVAPAADQADEFLRLACLGFGAADGPDRWTAAEDVLARAPSLSARSIHVATTTGDVDAVHGFLAGDGALANRTGGPFDWPPLLYVTYGRTENPLAATIVRMLLDAGADPNAGYLWHGIYPFTALTGVFGEGEQGPQRQPRHPAEQELAVMLLQAGADPNDSQALYNRMFQPTNDHLELLLRYGLGRGDGGPWRRRVPDVVAAPADLVRSQLHWAITHGMDERVRLLVERGVDVVTPFDGGDNTSGTGERLVVTASQLATSNGYTAMAELLVAAGSPAPALDPLDALIGAAMSADATTIDSLVAGDSTLLERLCTARPGLLTWAAASGRADAVRLLVRLGYDVDSLGRGDAPIDEPWETALHQAAHRGDRTMAELLLGLGADPNVRDARFDSTPLGWARHSSRDDLVALLEPVTVP